MTDRPSRMEARVTGHVQGVGFRYFVLRRAAGLGLVGWVANVADGTVRCVAEGPEAGLHALVAALQGGPPGSKVERVDVDWSEATDGFDRFAVRSGAHRGD